MVSTSTHWALRIIAHTWHIALSLTNSIIFFRTFLFYLGNLFMINQQLIQYLFLAMVIRVIIFYCTLFVYKYFSSPNTPIL